MSKPIYQLRNLGEKMAKYCAAIGVHDEADLRERGYMSVYLVLKERHPKVMNRMALYALYGALADVNCLRVPQPVKAQLEQELQLALKQSKATKCKNAPISDAVLQALP